MNDFLGYVLIFALLIAFTMGAWFLGADSVFKDCERYEQSFVGARHITCKVVSE